MSASFYIACKSHEVRGPELVFRKWHSYTTGDAFRSVSEVASFSDFCDDHSSCLEDGSVSILPEWRVEEYETFEP
jgi:hypothetical protein